MLSRIRPRLTYANVMSSVAVFVVLGGGAYATHTHKIGTKDLKKNAVTTAKLSKGAVGTGKLKPQAVATGKVKPEAIGVGKLKEPAVSTPKLFDGAVETDKIANEAVETGKLAPAAVEHGKLADGAVIASKLGTITRRSMPATSIAAGGTEQRLANCLAGEQPISGGGSWSGFIGITAASQLHVVHSFPTAEGNWVVRVHNGTGAARNFTMHILCLEQ